MRGCAERGSSLWPRVRGAGRWVPHPPCRTTAPDLCSENAGYPQAGKDGGVPSRSGTRIVLLYARQGLPRGNRRPLPGDRQLGTGLSTYTMYQSTNRGDRQASPVARAALMPPLSPLLSHLPRDVLGWARRWSVMLTPEELGAWRQSGDPAEVAEATDWAAKRMVNSPRPWRRGHCSTR